MATETVLNKLTINSVESREVYQKMQEKGLINEDEIYLVSSDDAGEDYLANPEGGSAGQVLTKTADGAEWKDAAKPTSVNGMSGGTLTSDLKVGNSSLGTNGYVKGTWLQSTANISLSTAAPKIAVLSNDGWIYSRTPAQIKSDIGLGNVENTKLSTHTGNSNIHVTAAEKTAWNAKGDTPTACKVKLTVAGWNSSAKTQSVTIDGVSADEASQLLLPMPTAASKSAYDEAGIQMTGQAANSVTFTCDTVPAAAIEVWVVIQSVKDVSPPSVSETWVINENLGADGVLAAANEGPFAVNFESGGRSFSGFRAFVD